jgi:YegS/Rv2252/BmrU family lipid kinase
MKKILLIINLNAGTGNARGFLPDIVTGLAERDCEVTVYPVLPGKMDAEDILVKTKGRFDQVMCCGGDGTLNHVISGLMELEKPIPYGFIPTGSCNDFSRSLNDGREPTVADVVANAAEGRPFAYDIGRFNDKYFNYVAAFGAFTDVSYETPQKYKNVLGYGAYVLTALSKVPDGLATRLPMTVKYDNGSLSGDFIFGGFCNSRSVGGVKTPFLSDSKLTDGLFEMVLIYAPKDLFALNETLASLRGGNTNDPRIVVVQSSHYEITFDREVAWTLDGEDGGKCRQAQITVLPKAVEIMVSSTFETP